MSTALTPSLLQQIMDCPLQRAEECFPAMVDAMWRFQIISPEQIACFLTEVRQESTGLVDFAERADGTIYEGRLDLGNVRVGDGPRFKGAGPIQVTGRSNFTAAQAALTAAGVNINILVNPDLARTVKYGFWISCWWWNAHGGNTVALRLPLLFASLCCGRLVNRGNADSSLPAQGEADRIAAFHHVISFGTLRLPLIPGVKMLQLQPVTMNGWPTLWNNGDPWGSPFLDKHVVIPGATGRDGLPVTVLGGIVGPGPWELLVQWVGQQWHTRVEPVYLADGFDYRPKRGNSSDASEHAAGTAVDFNAPDHPMTGQNENWVGFSSQQVATLNAIERQTDVDGQGPLINLGGHWGDAMHIERAAGASDVRIAAALQVLGAGGGAGPGKPPGKDWFDMATEADLETAVKKVLTSNDPAVQAAMTGYIRVALTQITYDVRWKGTDPGPNTLSLAQIVKGVALKTESNFVRLSWIAKKMGLGQ